MDIKVIVAAHKPYIMPKDNMYLPLHVGRALAKQDIGWQGDNTGNNISLKNSSYCELTGLYWAWKNIKADAIGLVHYRRLFRGCEYESTWFDALLNIFSKARRKILSNIEAEKLISQYSVLLPKKRRYYIETIKNQYADAHDIVHLQKVREIIKVYHSEYLEAFDKHMNERSGHMFNMFIMRYNCFTDYCTWLFDVLFRLERKIDGNNRVLGYIGERLLDVWITKNVIDYKELSIFYTENQYTLKKYANFVKRFMYKRIMNKKNNKK